MGRVYDPFMDTEQIVRESVRSQAVMKSAARLIPGGVNSPVRAYRAVGGVPPVIAKGAGAIITDIDGNEYVDHVCSWGALILGHADDRVVVAVDKAAAKGCSFGAPTEGELKLAELIASRVPAIGMVRLVSSGTEAAMSALRLARGITGRDGFVKFEGCYHGHSDALLVGPGSGPLTFGEPSSPGIPRQTAADTYVAPYNDLAATEAIFKQNASSLACIIVEPVAANMGLIPPADGFLAGLRSLCDKYGALLIFDEVITGFRVAPGGASELFGIKPDLVCLGKILGGGLPLAAFGGSKQHMERLAPCGAVYQAGTLSGNPIAVGAGLATLEAIGETGFHEALEAKALRLHEGLQAAAAAANAVVQTPRVGSILWIAFTGLPVTDQATAKQCDTKRFAKFFHAMLDRGVYLPPSQFECLFVSAAHTDEEIDRTIEAAREAFVVANG